MTDFEEAAAELRLVDESGLSQVSKLAQMQLTLEQRLVDLEEELKQAKRDWRSIAEDQLPAAMAEHNITELKLEDGSAISVKKFYSASIPKDRADEAFRWLVDNNYGDLIKNQVATNFVRGQEAEAEAFAEELANKGMPVNTRKWVEPMTLKAFAKDQIERGSNLPFDLFGLFIGEKAKITTPKR
jgi:hypothetical protein|tara:strand:+ start:993 stop:1547 length:555 start_codon:yes stop_codon:yes gene_type:complete